MTRRNLFLSFYLFDANGLLVGDVTHIHGGVAGPQLVGRNNGACRAEKITYTTRMRKNRIETKEYVDDPNVELNPGTWMHIT